MYLRNNYSNSVVIACSSDTWNNDILTDDKLNIIIIYDKKYSLKIFHNIQVSSFLVIFRIGPNIWNTNIFYHFPPAEDNKTKCYRKYYNLKFSGNKHEKYYIFYVKNIIFIDTS